MKKLSKRSEQVSNTVMAFAIFCNCNMAGCYSYCGNSSSVEYTALTGVKSSVVNA